MSQQTQNDNNEIKQNNNKMKTERRKYSPRKSKDERIAELTAQAKKYQEKAEELNNKIQQLSKSKEERKKDDARRKILAGSIILKMINDKQSFTIEKYKEEVLSSIKNDDDKNFFMKLFNV